MADPITNLQGGTPEVAPIPLPMPQPPLPPQAPPTILPEEVNKGMMPPGAVEPQAIASPQFEYKAPLAVPEFEAAPLQAPALTGNQQAVQIMGPGIQQEVMGMRKENQLVNSQVMAPIEAPRMWEPPNLEESETRFGYNYKVLVESFVQQAKQRQDTGEAEWLQRNMAAIEAMSRPNTSATSNAMDWVNQMIGASEDGGRRYVGPAVFDKQSGEWKGSAVGGVLYGLGILQNSAVGGFMDISNMFQNVDRGIKQAYETFTPPWLKGNIKNALNSMEPLMKGGAIHTPGINLPTNNRYNDGKSNFIEALRGAQYSFSDKQNEGFGINNDKAFKASLNPGDYELSGSGIKLKDGKGFDVNPSVIGGLAADVILGGKVDKVATKLLSKITPKKAATSVGTALVPDKAPSQPSKNFTPRQLEIPFQTGPIKNAKPVVPPLPPNLKNLQIKPKAKPPTSDVQQVLPIASMMDEYRGAVAATSKSKVAKATMKAASEGGDKQLTLKLGVKSKAQPKQLQAVENLPKVSGTGAQLKLKFDILPEALPPKALPLRLVDISDIENLDDLVKLPPDVKGKILRNVETGIDEQLAAIEQKMVNSPDVGRRFVSETPPTPITPYTPTHGRGKFVQSAQDFSEVEFFHGTKVKNLDIKTVRPEEGGTLSELGTAVYLTPSSEIATLAAKATPSIGLPAVGGREFGEGSVHRLRVQTGAVILDGTDKNPALGQIAEVVGQDFPALRNTGFDGKSISEIFDAAALLDTSAAGRLQFQQRLVAAFKAEGIDGVTLGDNFAIFNPQVVNQLDAVDASTIGQTLDESLNARASLEEWGDDITNNTLSNANALDAKATALSQSKATVKALKDEAATEVYDQIKIEGLMDHPSRTPEMAEPDFSPNVIGSKEFEEVAKREFSTFKTLDEAYDAKLTDVQKGLTDESKLEILATNPVTNKVNLDVLYDLKTQFIEEMPTGTPKPPTKVLNMWATQLANGRKADKVAAARQILDEIAKGGDDYYGYLERLSKLDPGNRIRNAADSSIDDYMQRIYC